MEVEAVDEGKLAQILVDEGTEGVAVNTPIAVLAGNGEDLRVESPAASVSAPAPKPAPRAEAPAPQPRPATAALAPTPRAEPDKDWGPTKPITVREALRDAMAAGTATRRQGVPDRRGGRAVPGRLQDQPGPARRVRPEARHRHADHRARLHRHVGRRGAERTEADRRVHDLQLRHAGDGSDHQLGGQDAVHVGRPDGLSDRVPRPQRRRRARRRTALAVLRELVRACAGTEGGGAVVVGRCQGAAARGDPRSQSGHRAGERNPLRPHLRLPDGRGLHPAARPRQGRARRPACDHRRVQHHGRRGAEGGRGAGRAGHRGGGDQPALAAPVRHRDRGREREEDQPARDRSRKAGRSPASAPRSRCR